MARNVNFILDWLGLVQILALFWVIYEVLGLIFFQVFHFFAKQQVIPNTIPSNIPATPNYQPTETAVLTEKVELQNPENATKKPIQKLIPEEVEVVKADE